MKMEQGRNICKIAITMLLSFLCGCESKPSNMTRQEAAEYQAQEERRAQEMLSETSPRNMNHQQPKAVPEFRASVPGWRGASQGN